jgi:hypothetical protein
VIKLDVLFNLLLKVITGGLACFAAGLNCKMFLVNKKEIRIIDVGLCLLPLILMAVSAYLSMMG